MTGIANDKLRLYGLQFHPEVDLTVNGKAMLRSFLFDVAGLTPNFTMESREAACIRYIREKVGTNKVLVSRLNFFCRKCIINIITMHLNKMRLKCYYTNVFRMQYLSRNIFLLSPMYRFKKLEQCLLFCYLMKITKRLILT